jgi:signal transduction histidine kinase
MLKIRNLSIRTKITLIIIIVSLIAILVSFAVLTFFNITNLRKDLVNQSSLIARLVGEYSEYALVFGDKKAGNENLENLDAIPKIISADIYTSSGNFFASFQNKKPNFNQLITPNSAHEYDDKYLHIYEPVLSANNEFLGSIYLLVSLDELSQSVEKYLFVLIVLIFFVLLLIIILARNFQTIISRPILRLAGLTKKITETNDFSIRIGNKYKDEMGILYDGFNKMLDEIERNEKEIRHAQNELKESQELFSTFMEMLPAAAFIKNNDSTYQWVNKFLSESFQAGNWIGNKGINRRSAEKRCFNIENDEKAKISTQYNKEYILDKRKRNRYFEIWKFPIIRQNKPLMIGGIAIDITERKLAEEQAVFYVNELERNNQELEEFNYVASHDLREPLRTITSYCELLAEDLGENITKNVKQDLDFITDATTRMNRLILDLLHLSRTGRVVFEMKEVDLNQVMNLVIQDLRLKIKETNATILLKNLPVVLGDAIQLQRVFQNLITNALKFKSATPPILNIEAAEKRKTIEISVSDNGIGIEKHYQHQIFSAFKRLHPRDVYEGTGIGLAICKKIIERHNGTIHVESEPGKGSSFIITLQKKRNKA